MKTIILSAFLLSTSYFSQDLKKGDLITLKAPVVVITGETVVMNNEKGETATHLVDGTIYKVIKTTGGKTQLKALNFDAESPAGKIYNNKIYTVLDTNLIENFDKREQKERLSIGIVTLPFKYRPQDKESFETEFNINTTLNIYLFDWGRGSGNIQLGTGFGSIKLDPLNSSLLAENSVNAITLGAIAGPMVQYKNVQFGLYAGVDIINNNSQLNWMHNGKMWFGLGIGYNLFKIDLGGDKNSQ